MTDDEHRTMLASYLTQAADRLDVTLDGAPVHGLYDRTIAVKTSGPAWLRLTAERPTWATADTMWDGVATATGTPFDQIPMPRHLRSLVWTEGDFVVRADLLSFVAQHPITTGRVLVNHPDLPDQWWSALRGGLDPLRHITASQRVAADPRDQDFRNHLLAMFGVQVDPERVQMTMAHGDLHFGNLTAPDLVILDWENWGWAPLGYDAALLACSAVLHPDITARVHTEFADVLDTYSGAVALLTAAANYLHHVENGEHPDLAIPLRRHIDTVVRVHLTV